MTKKSMGMTEREHEIPAYAGMTKKSMGMTKDRGNDEPKEVMTNPHSVIPANICHAPHTAILPTAVMPAKAGILS
jgi:hypothetical protein